jgi:uncharacterized RDD family membrane protein YckC
MKCPKCQYISFDSNERCRNCGYEFSLAADPASFDLPIQTGDEALGPLSDFALEHDKSPVRSAAAPATPLADFAPTPPPRPITSAFDLPLFKERRRDDDVPLVTPSAVPRPPVAVRKSMPVSRPLSRASDEPGLDLDAAPDPPRAPRRSQVSPEVIGSAADDDADESVAAVGARLLAAVVDVVILGSIGLLVLYLTLKVCGLQFARVAAIPPAPFGAFLLLIAGGYLTLFTAAGGQTIGKMAAGIRVVSTDIEQRRVSLGHSVVRAAAYMASALTAGLGFLPALFGGDRRAMHDRLADTRVVKA